MPVTTATSLCPISKAEFRKLDDLVMSQAFESQNQLGRLCDEVIYQNDLAARLRGSGAGSVQTEVRVTVTYQDFRKQYSLDLVVADAAIYELKTVQGLVGEHEAQLLNYLFLCGSYRGKLLNFRPAQVEARFVNAALTPEQRHQFEVETARWHEEEEIDPIFRTTVLGLLEDWGTGLDLALYAEALTYFLGGVGRGLRLVPLQRAGVGLGNQHFHLLSADTAFQLTVLLEGAEEYESQLGSLLRLTPLRAVQWVNVARHQVRFVTLRR